MGIRIALVILSICSLSLLSAQKKVIYEGEACYLHIVEKGNTLYGISKEFAIPTPKLLEFNPAAKVGLSIGQKIYIPIKEISRREAKKSPELEGNVLVHKVRKGETLYSLSKKYQIDQGKLLEANPGLAGAGLKKGQDLRIPTISVMVEKSLVKPAREDTLVHHEVIQGETLYSLSKNYEVEIDDIKKANGGLPEGLRTGMTLRLPIRRNGMPIEAEPDPIDVVKEEIEVLDISEGVTLDIGLLLPFALGLTDTTNNVIPRSQDDIMKLTDIAYEFYRGSQMALAELSESGLSATVQVIDVSSEKKDITRCLNRKGLTDLDLVIGPLHKDAFEMLSSDGRLSGVFRVSPISSTLGAKATRDPNTARIAASDKGLILNIIEHIQKEHSGSRIILLSGENKSYHKEFMQQWKAYEGLPDSLTVSAVKQLEWDKNAGIALQEALDPDGPNIIIFPVIDRPSITDLMSNLAMTSFRDQDITLYGMEQWMKYDNLDADVLDRVNLHVPASSYVDYNDERTVEFIQSYEKEYGTVPSASGYALLSYDITRYYLRGVMYYGDSFLAHQDQVHELGLSTGFEMRKSEEGAWINDFGIILEYRDHEFLRVD